MNALSNMLIAAGMIAAAFPALAQKATAAPTDSNDQANSREAPLDLVLEADETGSAGGNRTDHAVQTIAVEPLPEEAPQPSATAKARRNVLVEEIVVTAQKREENIQDVPIAVSAFSGDQLAVLGIESTRDLGLVTPGLQFSEIAGFTLVYLRGVGTDSFLPYADPSVATYVDGLYIPAQQGLVNSLGGVERVEVLKGPQGTLFGRNSTGGAINVITKSPDDLTQVSAQAEIGSYGTRKLQAFAGFPLFESLSASISGIYNDADPYYRQVTDDLGPAEAPPADALTGDRSHGGRLKLRWTPGERFDITLAAYHIAQSGAGSTIGALKRPSLLARAFGIEPEERDYEVHRNEPTAFAIENSAAYGNLKWMLPRFDVKLIGGYQDIRTTDAYYDFDNSAQDLVSFYTHNAFSRLTTAELQVASNTESWLAERLTWIGGVYYLHSYGGYDPITLEAAGSTLPILGPLGLLPDRGEQPSGDTPGVFADPAPGARVDIHGVLETHSYSGFLQGDYAISDWLGVTLGGRYQIEDRFLIDQRVTAPSDDGSSRELIGYTEPKVTQENFSPKVSLNLRFADGDLLYLSWTKGYKSGTYNGINIYTPPTYVDPEVVRAYEVGIKTTLIGGNLRLNAAAFYNDVDDMQVTYVSLSNGGAITFENAGSSRIRGAEFDAVWAILPEWNPDLILTGGLSYLDSIFTDYENGSGFDEQTGLFFSKTGNFTGNRVPRSPEWTGNLGLHQVIATHWGLFEIGVDGYYNSGFYYSAQNTDVARQRAYSLINARTSYTYEPWNLKLTVFGQNLDDETYSYAQFTADFGTNYTLAPPRTYGVRINWSFGA